MKKILILFAHPAMEKSHINKIMAQSVKDLDGVTFHDLYANYPDFMIDVQHEQELCESHDVLIFQHPFYWYSSPSLVKEWFDLVLEHGWAYGSAGNALEGKLFFQAFSAGGDNSTYQPEGANMFTITELTSPYRATANLCRMKWLPPFTVLGVHRGLPDEQINLHAEDYRRAIIALRDGMLDLEALSSQPYFNSDLDSIIRRS